MEFLNFKKPLNGALNYAFKRGDFHGIKKNASFLDVGILGPIPNHQRVHKSHGPLLTLCSNCLSPAHSRPGCKNLRRCRNCLLAGHDSGHCRLLPRTAPFPLFGETLQLLVSFVTQHRCSVGLPSLLTPKSTSRSQNFFEKLLAFTRLLPRLSSPGVCRGDFRLRGSSTTSTRDHLPLRLLHGPCSPSLPSELVPDSLLLLWFTFPGS